MYDDDAVYEVCMTPATYSRWSKSCTTSMWMTSNFSSVIS